MLEKLRGQYVSSVDAAVDTFKKQKKCVGNSGEAGCRKVLATVLDPTKEDYEQKKRLEQVIKDKSLIQDVSPYKRILNSQGSAWGAPNSTDPKITEHAKERYLSEMARFMNERRRSLDFNSYSSDDQKKQVCNIDIRQFEQRFRGQIAERMVAETAVERVELAERNPLVSKMESDTPSDKELNGFFDDLIKENETLRNTMRDKKMNPHFGVGCQEMQALTNNPALNAGIVRGMSEEERVSTCYQLKTLGTQVEGSCGGVAAMKAGALVTACAVMTVGTAAVVCATAGVYEANKAYNRAEQLKGSATLEERKGGSELKKFDNVGELNRRKRNSIIGGLIAIGAPAAGAGLAKTAQRIEASDLFTAMGPYSQKAVQLFSKSGESGSGVSAGGGKRAVVDNAKAGAGNAASEQTKGMFGGKQNTGVSPQITADAEKLLTQCAQFTKTSQAQYRAEVAGGAP